MRYSLPSLCHAAAADAMPLILHTPATFCADIAAAAYERRYADTPCQRVFQRYMIDITLMLRYALLRVDSAADVVYRFCWQLPLRARRCDMMPATRYAPLYAPWLCCRYHAR